MSEQHPSISQILTILKTYDHMPTVKNDLNKCLDLLTSALEEHLAVLSVRTKHASK